MNDEVVGVRSGFFIAVCLAAALLVMSSHVSSPLLNTDGSTMDTFYF